MAQVAGITIERTYAGKPNSIKFNYNKYGRLLQAFFIEHGIDFSDIPNETTKRAMKEVEQNKTKGFKDIKSLLTDLKQ